MKILVLCAAILLLNGCTVFSSVIDRYEKYKIEKRLEELEQN